MRFLLAIMAMTFFAVSVGCDKPAEDKKADPATSAATDGEGGDEAAEGEGGDEAAEGEDDKGAAAAAPGETQTVSLKLPGMT